MSKIQKILAEAGFPNTPEGRAAFYKKFPNKEDWENFQKMKEGGNLSGAPHNGQPTADEFFNFGDPTFGNLNIPYGNFAYGGGPLYHAAEGVGTPPNPTTPPTPGVPALGQISPETRDLFNTGTYTRNQANSMVEGQNPVPFNPVPQLQGPDPRPYPLNQKMQSYNPNATLNNNVANKKVDHGSYDMHDFRRDAKRFGRDVRGTARGVVSDVKKFGRNLFNPQKIDSCFHFDEGGDVASPTNYGAFPNTQYGGLLDQSNNQDYPVFQTGGNEFEKGGSFYEMINNLKKLKKKAFSKGGDTTMQGGNETDYPAKVRGEFDNAIKTNLHNSLVEEAGNDVLGMYKQMGGPQFNQMNPDNQAYQQMLQNNINQGQSGLNQAANNLFDASMDLSRSYGVKNKVKVKAQKGVNVDPGFEIDPDTNKPMTREKSEEIRNKKAKREKLLEEMLTAYEQRGQAQPNYNYGNYPAQQYGYPAHYYNQGYGMRHFPMNYNYFNKISASDVEALKNLANNPSSNLKDFSHRHFGPWSKTKMTFGYKDQTPFTENKVDPALIDPSKKQIIDEIVANPNMNLYGPGLNPDKTTERGFQEEAMLSQQRNDMAPTVDNQYQNKVEVNPLQRFIPKQIMIDSQFQKYGGLLKAQVGIQSATGNLGVSANPIFMGNSFQPIGNAPGAAPSNISYQGATTPAYSTPESVGLQNKNIEMKGMGTNEKQVTVTNKQKPKFNQQAMANWEIAGANMLASGLEQRDVAANTAKLKASRVADNAFLATPENAMSRGDYDPNSGRLRTDQYTPVQFHGQSVVKYGGYMQDGGIPQQDNKEQQIMAGVAQMLQQGAESEQILQQLVEMGLPEEQASQIIETVIDQLQMNEQSAQEQPQQEMAPAMKYGGYFDGGMYEEGQELDLSPEEIEELKAQGYELDELD